MTFLGRFIISVPLRISLTSRVILDCSHKVYTVKALQYCHQLPPDYVNKHEIDNSLWFTTLPAKKKNACRLIVKKKKTDEEKKKALKPRVELVSCKNKNLNFYHNQFHSKKHRNIPLASSFWKNSKYAGDHFTINAVSEHPAFLVSRKEGETLPGSFEETQLDPKIVDFLHKKKISVPTAVQGKAIPALLSGDNGVIAADTGSGKTYAYLLPMVHLIKKWKNKISNPVNSPFGIIVVPQRNLAVQVGAVADELCKEVGLKCLTYIGGHTKRIIKSAPVDDVDILVASFGVISKLTTFKIYKSEFCKFLVLDEADTLLDDSYNEKLLHFCKRFPIQYQATKLEEFPSETQLVLSSATMPTSLEPLLSSLVSTDKLQVIKTEYLHRIQPHIPQKFLRLRCLDKAPTILKLLKSDLKNNIPTIVFCNHKRSCNWLTNFLNQNGVPCSRICSDMHSGERIQRYDDFQEGKINILVCTDIASRGLNTCRAKHVINFDFPVYIADYIHRCGRTGRIGHDKNCKVTSLVVGPREIELVNEIETSARRRLELPKVNNNISRILYYRAERRPEQPLSRSRRLRKRKEEKE